MPNVGETNPDFFRWRGSIEQFVVEIDRRLNAYDQEFKNLRLKVELLTEEITIIRTKLTIMVGLWSTLGGIVGAAISTITVRIFF